MAALRKARGIYKSHKVGFITFVLPFIVILILCCFFMLAGNELQRTNAHTEESSRIELAGKELENAIQSAKTTAMEASLQPSIIELMNNSQVSSMGLKEASAYLNNVILVQPYISSISVCSENGVVLRFPEFAYVEDEEDIFTLASSGPALQPIPRTCENMTGRSLRVLSLILRSDQQASAACVIVDIDLDSLSNISELNDLYRIENDILLVNCQNQVVFSNRPEYFAQQISPDDRHFTHTNDLGTNVSVLTSVPKAHWFGSFGIVTLIICILLLGFLSVYMIKGVFMPLCELISHLDVIGGQSCLNWTRSFPQQIQVALRNLDSVQKDSQEMLTYSLLTKLFVRNPPENEAFLLHELLRHQVVTQEHAVYCAVVLRADGIQAQMESTELTAFKLRKAGRLFQRSLPSAIHCEMVQNDRNLLSGMIYVSPDHQDKLYSITKTIEMEIDAWKDACGLSFTFGVSYPVEGLQNLRGAYLQALSCTDHRLLLGCGKLITPEMCSIQRKIDPAQVEQYMEELVQTIIQHDETKHYECLKNILDLLWSSTYSFLVGTLLKLAERFDVLSATVKLEIEMKNSLETQIERMETKQDVYDWLVKRSNILLNAFYKAEQSKACVCIAKTLEYIDQHFADADLSVQQVSDAFHISPQYFSKLFNQETRCSFPQYLTEKRLLHAYNLLNSDSTLSIQEVCHLCGYSSRTYFTASFKNRFGISPSKVRYISKSS